MPFYVLTCKNKKVEQLVVVNFELNFTKTDIPKGYSKAFAKPKGNDGSMTKEPKSSKKNRNSTKKLNMIT